MTTKFVRISAGQAVALRTTQILFPAEMMIIFVFLVPLIIMVGVSVMIIKYTSNEANNFGEKNTKLESPRGHDNELNRESERSERLGTTGVEASKVESYQVEQKQAEQLKQRQQELEEVKSAMTTTNEKQTDTKQKLAATFGEKHKLSKQAEPVNFKYVNCDTSLISETNAYPIVKLPERGRRIKFPRSGRTGRRGASEEKFFANLLDYFPKSGPLKIYDDRFLATGNNKRPFEPDIVLLHEYGENSPNIFLDIEIDEPYNGIHRQPIHCQGDDDARDSYFTERGWIVLRFAERQIHEQPKLCYAFIARLIAVLDRNYQVPDALKDVAILADTPAWNMVQSRKWEKEKYREKYLGIEFRLPSVQSGDVEPVSATVADKIFEADFNKKNTLLTAEPKPNIVSPLNINLPASALKFDAEKHQYYINGQPATAVSTLYKRFFTPFPLEEQAIKTARKRGIPVEEVKEEWEKKRVSAARAGTTLHQLIEQFYDNEKITLEDKGKDFNHFVDFQRENAHLNLLKPQTEWRIFSQALMIAGTVDFVAHNEDGTLSIYDWKRSAKVVDESGKPINTNQWQPNDGPLSDLANCPFNHYSLQQNLYKRLLEDEYGVTVSNMYLVILHPDYDRYYIVKVKEMTEHVQRMIDAHIINQ